MLKISPIPAFEDNYLWLLETESHDGCAIVDPGDAEPVIRAIEQRGLHLATFLIK